MRITMRLALFVGAVLGAATCPQPALGADEPKPAPKATDDWDRPAVAELMAITKPFRTKLDAQGNLDGRHLKALTALTQLGAEAKPALPIVTELLRELWAEVEVEPKPGEKQKSAKYSALPEPTVVLLGQVIEWTGKLGRDGEPALAALAVVLNSPKGAYQRVYERTGTEWVRGSNGVYYETGKYEYLWKPLPTEQLRVKATEALVRIKSPAAVPGLVKALKGDPQPVVRAASAVALGQLSAAGATDDLIGVLREDKEPTVRAAVARALAELGATKAVESLLAQLGDDADPGVRIAAAIAAGKIGVEKLTLAERKQLYQKLKAETDSQQTAEVIAAVRQAMKAIREASNSAPPAPKQP